MSSHLAEHLVLERGRRPRGGQLLAGGVPEVNGGAQGAHQRRAHLPHLAGGGGSGGGGHGVIHALHQLLPQRRQRLRQADSQTVGDSGLTALVPGQ